MNKINKNKGIGLISMIIVVSLLVTLSGMVVYQKVSSNALLEKAINAGY